MARWLLGAVLLTGALAAVAWGAGDPPHLTILPSSQTQTKPRGRNALLTCRASGPNAQLVNNLRWRGPDTLEVPQPPRGEARPPVYAESFSPDNSLSLVFQKLEFEHAGNYTCEGDFAGGPSLSKSVEIRVIQAISFDDAPPEQFPKRGQRAEIRCKVSAEPAPTVDWLKDDGPIPARLVPDVDRLIIPNATEADDGFYTCRAIVVSTGELQTRVIRVEVHVPPSFREGDASRNETATAGRDAALPCFADGRPPPEYKWVQRRTGLDVGTAGGHYHVDTRTGTLQLTPPAPDDEGEYRCVAHNPAGDSEQVVFLRVAVPPKIAAVVNVTRAVETGAELRCEARGRPPPEIFWRRVGEEALFSVGVHAPDTRISTVTQAYGRDQPDRSDGTIAWSELRRADDGLYTCVARNEAGFAEANAHLTVEFPPSFANTPYSKMWSWDNKIINITCLAESIPNATITWHYNNRDIEKPYPDTFFRKYGEGPQSWLEFTPNPNKGYATYKCVAVNKHGRQEHEIVLYRAEVPGPLNQAIMDIVTATTIRFKLHGPSSDGGIPTLSYSVRYRPLDSDLPSGLWKEHSWPAESSYILEGLEPQRRYTFEFAARNEVGVGPWSAALEKVMPRRSPPEAPRLLHRNPGADPSMPEEPSEPVQSAYPTYFELRWQIPADNGERILAYRVNICPARVQGDVWKEDTTQGRCYEKFLDATDQTTSYRLQHLQPGSNYLIDLKARNSIGYSEGSVLQLRTAPDYSKGTLGESNFNGGSPLHSTSALLLVPALLLLPTVLALPARLTSRRVH